MDAATYPTPEVQKRLGEHLVCFKPEVSENPDLARRFVVTWTPGIVVLDGDQRIHYRAYGFYPPFEFTQLLLMARGMFEFNHGRFKESLAIYQTATKESGPTPFHPEALYWLGVSAYKTGDRQGLLKAWNLLLDSHPHSLWSKKVSFIRKK